jgi:hypothetical protein
MKRTAELPTADVLVKKRRRGGRIVLLLFILAALCAAYTWITLHYTYASGERTGYVQKISKKGWVCKTWEGELAMTTVPGTAPQIFRFSVPDDTTAHQIMQAAGQRVVLTYAQRKGVPSSCFGETEYFITGVRPLGQ